MCVAFASDLAHVHLFLLLLLLRPCNTGSGALITPNSQRMIQPVYAHHYKLRSPPSRLPRRALLFACLGVCSHTLRQRGIYSEHFIMHSPGEQTEMCNGKQLFTVRKHTHTHTRIHDEPFLNRATFYDTPDKTSMTLLFHAVVLIPFPINT